MKSSVAVMLYVLDVLKDVPLRGSVQAHVVSDEETGGAFGTKFLLEEIAAGRLPGPTIASSAKKATSRSATPNAGYSPSTSPSSAAPRTPRRRVSPGSMPSPKRPKRFSRSNRTSISFHPAVGKPVISINTIKAGVAHNVVPGECTFSIDRRLIPGETRESRRGRDRGALDAVAGKTRRSATS